MERGGGGSAQRRGAVRECVRVAATRRRVEWRMLSLCGSFFVAARLGCRVSASVRSRGILHPQGQARSCLRGGIHTEVTTLCSCVVSGKCCIRIRFLTGRTYRDHTEPMPARCASGSSRAGQIAQDDEIVGSCTHTARRLNHFWHAAAIADDGMRSDRPSRLLAGRDAGYIPHRQSFLAENPEPIG